MTTGIEWEIVDVEDAGRRLVAEVEILRARPEVPAQLDLIERLDLDAEEIAERLFFYNGDDSGFRAVRVDGVLDAGRV